MSLTIEERKAVVMLEMEKARETFEEMGILASANRWNGAQAECITRCFMR